MAYDRELANRLRDLLAEQARVTEKSMFGGLAFLVNGKMAVCATSGGGLMVRVDPTESESLTAEADVQRFVMNGRELNGWLLVDAAAITSSTDLERWVTIGTDYASSLPAK